MSILSSFSDFKLVLMVITKNIGYELSNDRFGMFPLTLANLQLIEKVTKSIDFGLKIPFKNNSPSYQ